MHQDALRKLARAAVAGVRHPFGVTCLDCGFLALGDNEVGEANRVLLRMKGSGGCPPLEKLRCFRGLWVEYDLTFIDVNAGAIFDELAKQRRDCEGFLRYKPGWSPSLHRDLLLKRLETWQKVLFLLLGSALTLLAGWIAKLIRLA